MIFEERIYGLKTLRSQRIDEGGKIIEGHAAVFGQTVNIGGAFQEVIERGAFDGCDLSDVCLLVNHNHKGIPMARTTAGTLEIFIDDIGLAFRANLDTENNQSAKELISALARGDIKGCSFALHVQEDKWENLDSDMPLRRILKISKVLEISCCQWPAYDATDVTIADRAKKIVAVVRQKANSNQAEVERLRKQILKQEETEEKKKIMNTPAKKPPRAVDIFGEALKEEKVTPSPFNVFGELRVMTVKPPAETPNSIVTPTHTSPTVNAAFPVVSSLIDGVTKIIFPNGDSFKQPYGTSFDDTAYYTDEAAEAHFMESNFDYAKIERCKFSCYQEYSAELERLPNSNYTAMIFENMRKAIRKALTREILFGIGEENGKPRIAGIFNASAKAIDPTTDYGISAITDTTLDEILEHYSGASSIEVPATLILSKGDLLAFAKVRTSTRDKFYRIEFLTGDSGKINGVPFLLDANLPAITDSQTQSGQYSMVFGNPRNYTLVEFSPPTVEKSRNFKFRQGITCARAEAAVGGAVTRRNGFIRVKKS